jgi:hypothetical protein
LKKADGTAFGAGILGAEMAVAMCDILVAS